MKRILIPLALVAGLLGPPAHAATTEEGIVAELREQGFSRIEIRRTLLGRTRIVATSPGYEREIVLNPASGVILRDFWTVRESGSDGRSGVVGRPNLRDGDGRAATRSGRDDSDDDDDRSGSGSDSRDDDDDDDDNDGGGGSDDRSDDDDDDDDDDGGDDDD